jgi:8-oxo-dGTP diphosphatase
MVLIMFKLFNRILVLSIVVLISAFLGYKHGIASVIVSQNSSQDMVLENKTKPILTVAGVVYVVPAAKFALIQRGKEPRGLAMFGGHVEPKESPEEAFIREAKEELNVDVTNLKLIGLHGKYGRDPRQHSVEGTYFCTTIQTPRAGSDAKSVMLYSVAELNELINSNSQDFAFDHGDILKTFFEDKANEKLYNEVYTK